MRTSSPYFPSNGLELYNHLDLVSKKIKNSNNKDATQSWYSPEINPLSNNLPNSSDYVKSNAWIYNFDFMNQFLGLIDGKEFKDYECVCCGTKGIKQMAFQILHSF